jgi:hypothetical protein
MIVGLDNIATWYPNPHCHHCYYASVTIIPPYYYYYYYYYCLGWGMPV